MKKLQYYHQPFALLKEQRVKTLVERMGIVGTGILLHIYLLLRKCGGKYPLDSIMGLAKGRQQEKQVTRVLTEFDLFRIDDGIVSLQSGLSAAELRPGSTVKPKDMAGEIRQKLREGYDGEMFPEEFRQMDSETLVRVNVETREHNEQEIQEIIEFV